MKKLIVLLIAVSFLGVTSCKRIEKEKGSDEKPLIEKKELKLESDIMTPELLWAFGRISEPVVSPDKTTVLYGVTFYDVAQNKGNRELYSMSVNGGAETRLTTTKFSEYSAIWRPDGKKICFMSAEKDGMQIWEMNPDGTGRTQISSVEGGITGFLYSPDGTKIVYSKEVTVGKTTQDLYPDLPLASGKIINDLMYRHWDQWVETFSHLFIADYDGVKITKDKDIMVDEPWESPVRPWGGMEQVAWSPDGKTLAYTSRKKTGAEYAVSTNTDIYLFDTQSGKTTNFTEGMMGYDMVPSFSPDGTMISWQSMKRDGYEADKIRLFIADLKTGSKKDYTESFDQNAENMVWTVDSKSVYFISDWHATDEIYQLTLSDGKIRKVTEGIHNYTKVIPAGNRLVTTRESMSMPSEMYAVDPSTGKDTQMTFINKNILDQLEPAKVEQRWIKTTDNKDMLTWVIFPPHFDPAKKYPAILFCEGGPQSTVSQFWSYRWNFQMMAANGYIVIAPNRRGLPGFGTEWNEQISGDYGGQNMKDYLSAVDAVSAEPYIDKNRLGAVGASYGGFSVYWLAGNHNKRFKAFIAHDGMFNLEAQYLETEEMWFVNWDLGGPFWDRNNKVAQNSYANSPHRFVQNWDTPILVIHGQLDYRISYTQGMQAFNAARLKGIPAQFLYFPDENHWVLKPQNSILWQRTFKSWLDKWLKQ